MTNVEALEKVKRQAVMHSNCFLNEPTVGKSSYKVGITILQFFYKIVCFYIAKLHFCSTLKETFYMAMNVIVERL